MSTDSMQPNITQDDAQLRYQGLIEHVKDIKSEIGGFPGAVNLGSLAASYLKMATTLFPIFSTALENEDRDTQLEARHKMVDKLAAEWEIVFQLIANAKLLGTNLNSTNDFSWLNVLVRYAQMDLNLSSWDFTIVPRVSMRYALTSFHYAPEFSALEIPVSSLNTAWEWSVLWHELAGRTIKDIKKKDPSTFDVQSIMTEAESTEREILDSINEMMAKLQKDEAVGSPLLNRIRRLFKIPQKPRWSRDWVEELFEDACSVLTFGKDFIPVLDSVLKRQEKPDDRRHPPRAIRIRMAKRLLDLDASSGDNESDMIEKDVANHLMALIRRRGLALPLVVRQNENNVHLGLRSIMKKFADGTVSSADTQAFKDELNREMENNPVYERKGAKDISVDITAWEEVASGNYKKMLALSFSELDAAIPLTTHGSDENGWMSITVHGTIHEFWHGFWNHK